MNRHDTTEMYSRTGDWLVDTVRRKPEALLLFAAGCALMLRSGRSSPSTNWSTRSSVDQFGSGARSMSNGMSRSLRDGVNQATDTVQRYAGDLQDRVSDAAGSYASAVGDYAADVKRNVSAYADDARRNLSAGSEHLMEQAASTYDAAATQLREQPLLIAALGLAAGAAVAALLPPTEVERQAFAPARDALLGAAGKMGENLREAAGQAGERLKEGVAEHAEGLKELAKDVGQAFASAAAGGEDDSRNDQAGAFGQSQKAAGTAGQTGGSGQKTVGSGMQTGGSGQTPKPTGFTGQSGMGQSGIGQSGIGQSGAGQRGTSQTGTGQAGIGQTAAGQRSASQTGTGQQAGGTGSAGSSGSSTSGARTDFSQTNENTGQRTNTTKGSSDDRSRT